MNESLSIFQAGVREQADNVTQGQSVTIKSNNKHKSKPGSRTGIIKAKEQEKTREHSSETCITMMRLCTETKTQEGVRRQTIQELNRKQVGTSGHNGENGQ